MSNIHKILLLVSLALLTACAQPGSLRTKEAVNPRELTMYIYPQQEGQQGQQVHIEL